MKPELRLRQQEMQLWQKKLRTKLLQKLPLLKGKLMLLHLKAQNKQSAAIQK
jgi:hypothetical protein